MRDLRLDQLHTFTRVIELGGFSAAAERLGISQPAVSLQVRQLEKRLGVRLVERVGKRAMATDSGRRLLAHAGRIEEAVGAALDDLAAYGDGAFGRVRIGTGATASIYLLPPILRDLRRRFPALEITVTSQNTIDVLKALEGNAVDIGLVTLPAPGRAFAVTPLLDDDFVAIAPAEGEPLPRTVTAAQLARRPLILYETAGNTRRLTDAWFTRAGVHPTPVMDLGNVEAIKQLVAAGLGVAVLPGSAIRRRGERLPITTHTLSPRLSRKLALVMRRDKVLGRGLREVIKALKRLG
ncbi:MAG: LysR family transcriptional regulator [Alphaproteobacteria bacterium]|nr:LysR family transcriptional regulator [Alphaproteobacteria bacterium]MCW5740069.1 LysR family transcriptional regulator [Alphaproteobacteria bacterium]